MSKYKLIVVWADEYYTKEYENVVDSYDEVEGKAREILDKIYKDAEEGNSRIDVGDLWDVYVAAFEEWEDIHWHEDDYPCFKYDSDHKFRKGWGIAGSYGGTIRIDW